MRAAGVLRWGRDRGRFWMPFDPRLHQLNSEPQYKPDFCDHDMAFGTYDGRLWIMSSSSKARKRFEALWRSGYRARLEILFLRERQFESGQRRLFC